MINSRTLALVGGALVAASGVAASISEGCMSDILAELPHLANTAAVLDIDEGSDFTLLAPSQAAAVALSELLLIEGCEMLVMEDFARIVSSWLISGTQVSPSDLSTDPLVFSPPATQPGLSFGLFTDASGDAFAEIFNAAGVSNNVVGLAPTGTSICGGSGTLIVTDELILNPAMLTRVRRFADTPDSPCEGTWTEEEEPVPVNEAFLSDVEFELAGNKTTATIPITAFVNSTAFDEDGNEVPVMTNVALAIMNDLDAQLNAAGTEFNVQVPVNVTINVITEGCDEAVQITTPVDITIGVAIVVEGAEIGGGTAVMLPACEEVGVAFFDRCGGMIGGSRFVSACADPSAICLQKNPFFAMCIPPMLLPRFLDQGFEGTQLQCQQ
eukprot:jgi/Ulvmu1/2052/UM120_0048.1